MSSILLSITGIILASIMENVAQREPLYCKADHVSVEGDSGSYPDVHPLSTQSYIYCNLS